MLKDYYADPAFREKVREYKNEKITCKCGVKTSRANLSHHKQTFKHKKWMEENGIMLPVVSLTMNYKKPARYDELLTLKTILKKQTSVKIEFDYELYNENAELLTTGNSVLVFVDMKTGRPMAPPLYIFELLNRME